MGKLTNYIMIMTGTILIFYIAGFIPKDSNSLLTLLLEANNITNLTIGQKVLLFLSGASVPSSIIIGFLTKDFRYAIAGPFAVYLLNLMLAFLDVYKVLYAASPIFAMIMLGSYIFLFYVTIVEWLLGQDT